MKTVNWLLAVGTMMVALSFGCADLSGGETEVYLPAPDPELLDPWTGEDVEQGFFVGIGSAVANTKAFHKVLLIGDGGSLRVPLKQATEELAGDFTLEMWLRFGHDGDQVIMSGTDIRMVLENGRLFAELGGLRFTGPSLTKDEWYHVAIVVEGNQVKLYVNGAQEQREIMNEGWIRPSRVLVLGHRDGNPRSFMGEVENLRLVSEAVYTHAFFNASQSFVSVDNTVFGYNFDEELPGGIVVDVVGKGINAQLEGHAGLTAGQF